MRKVPLWPERTGQYEPVPLTPMGREDLAESGGAIVGNTITDFLATNSKVEYKISSQLTHKTLVQVGGDEPKQLLDLPELRCYIRMRPLIVN
jgi:hypothetical protein